MPVFYLFKDLLCAKAYLQFKVLRLKEKGLFLVKLFFT